MTPDKSGPSFELTAEFVQQSLSELGDLVQGIQKEMAEESPPVYTASEPTAEVSPPSGTAADPVAPFIKAAAVMAFFDPETLAPVKTPSLTESPQAGKGEPEPR